MMRVSKNTKLILAIAIPLAVLIAAFAVCFFVVDIPPSFRYNVSVSEDDPQTLNVNMTISMPWLCKKQEVYVYLGNKNISLRSCTDSSGKNETPIVSNDIAAIPVSRGGSVSIDYDVSVSVSAKHGNRGAITDDYIVFDGDQVFLLPAEFYVFDEEGVENSVKQIDMNFQFPEDWKKIIPFEQIENPQWMDIYKISKNAFVFGQFDEKQNPDTGLTIYTLPGQAVENSDGFDSLFAYYTDLFGSKPSSYNIVLLPSDSSGEKIMGGAGTGTVAASFDPDLLRDWQLLSHRMFHAFYDNAAPYANVHAAPNLWLNEGLATYYENLATDALPETLKTQLGVDVNRQMALTFDQYLYMRLKDPFSCNFAPMDENQITSEAMSEFLHYTTAPLIVQAFENISLELGNEPNSLLHYCLKESSFEDRYTALTAAMDLLGSEAQDFCESYLVGVDIPSLWELKAYQPSSEDVLESLNYIEVLLGSWQKKEDSDYPTHIVSEDELEEAMSTIDDHDISLLSSEMEQSLKEYCPEVYALVADYYNQAMEQGFELDDKDLRFKMYGEESIYN